MVFISFVQKKVDNVKNAFWADDLIEERGLKPLNEQYPSSSINIYKEYCYEESNADSFFSKKK